MPHTGSRALSGGVISIARVCREYVVFARSKCRKIAPDRKIWVQWRASFPPPRNSEEWSGRGEAAHAVCEFGADPRDGHSCRHLGYVRRRTRAERREEIGRIKPWPKPKSHSCPRAASSPASFACRMA